MEGMLTWPCGSWSKLTVWGPSDKVLVHSLAVRARTEHSLPMQYVLMFFESGQCGGSAAQITLLSMIISCQAATMCRRCRG